MKTDYHQEFDEAFRASNSCRLQDPDFPRVLGLELRDLLEMGRQSYL